MAWGDGDHWTLEIDIPGGSYDFKFVVLREGGSRDDSDWEAGANRSLFVSRISGLGCCASWRRQLLAVRAWLLLCVWCKCMYMYVVRFLSAPPWQQERLGRLLVMDLEGVQNCNPGAEPAHQLSHHRQRHLVQHLVHLPVHEVRQLPTLSSRRLLGSHCA